MKKIAILLFLPLLLHASVLMPPRCFVDIKIVQLHKSEAVVSVVKIHTPKPCQIEQIALGQTHSINTSFNKVQKDRVYKAGVVRGSSMGEKGFAIPWIHWEIEF
ncbi:MAG: hypothetical protein ACQESH_05660 [Campylobacterota bacterium]